MAEPARIPPEEARIKVLSGEAILVCAYEDEEKFRNAHLEGAISLNDFRNKINFISKEQEIIFYCA